MLVMMRRELLGLEAVVTAVLEAQIQERSRQGGDAQARQVHAAQGNVIIDDGRAVAEQGVDARRRGREAHIVLPDAFKQLIDVGALIHGVSHGWRN